MKLSVRIYTYRTGTKAQSEQMFNLGEGHDQGKIFLVSALQGITGLVGKLLCIGGSHNGGLGI